MASCMARALTAALRMVDSVGTDTQCPLERHLNKISDIIRGIAMAFSSLSQVSKDTIRNDTGKPI